MIEEQDNCNLRWGVDYQIQYYWASTGLGFVWILPHPAGDTMQDMELDGFWLAREPCSQIQTRIVILLVGIAGLLKVVPPQKS